MQGSNFPTPNTNSSPLNESAQRLAAIPMSLVNNLVEIMGDTYNTLISTTFRRLRATIAETNSIQTFVQWAQFFEPRIPAVSSALIGSKVGLQVAYLRSEIYSFLHDTKSIDELVASNIDTLIEELINGEQSETFAVNDFVQLTTLAPEFMTIAKLVYKKFTQIAEPMGNEVTLFLEALVNTQEITSGIRSLNIQAIIDDIHGDEVALSNLAKVLTMMARIFEIVTNNDKVIADILKQQAILQSISQEFEGNASLLSSPVIIKYDTLLLSLINRIGINNLTSIKPIDTFTQKMATIFKDSKLLRTLLTDPSTSAHVKMILGSIFTRPLYLTLKQSSNELGATLAEIETMVSTLKPAEGAQSSVVAQSSAVASTSIRSSTAVASTSTRLTSAIGSLSILADTSDNPETQERAAETVSDVLTTTPSVYLASNNANVDAGRRSQRIREHNQEDDVTETSTRKRRKTAK